MIATTSYKRKNVQERILFCALLLIGSLLIPFHSVSADITESFNTILGFGIYTIATDVGGWIVSIGGLLLDYAITELVIGMGSYLNGSVGVAVDRLWVVVRDLFNILFIFGLIYIGFRTILFSEDSNTRKMLGSLIIAALLINFSLFITKSIVDFSNIAAFQVYNAIITSNQDAPTAILPNGSIAGNPSDPPSIAAAFLNATKLSRYGALTARGAGDGYAAYGIMVMILMIVAAYVFAAGAFVLVGRFIMLIFYMILSPAMFLGMIFPQLGRYSSLWWSKFLNYSFVAPAYLLLIYFSLFVVNALLGSRIGPGNLTLADSYDGTGADRTFTIIFFFFLAMGLLFVSLYVARSMGAAGAAGSIKIAQRAGKYIRTGAQSYVGRNTIGRAGTWLDKRAEERGVPSTSLRRQTYSSAANAKFGGNYSRKQVADAEEKAGRIRARRTQVHGISQAVSTGVTNTSDTDRVHMERKITGASTEQLLKVLSTAEKRPEEYNAIIASMSSGQFDAVMKSKEEDLDDVKKNKIAGIRSASVRERLIQNARTENSAKPQPEQKDLKDDKTALASGIGKASIAQLKIIGSETIMEHAADLSASQIDDIKKNDGFTETEKALILKARDEEIITRFNDPAKRSNLFKGKKDEDIAKLPKDVLTKPETIAFMKPGVLSQTMKTLSSADREKIRSQIKSTRPANDPLVQWLDSPRGSEF